MPVEQGTWSRHRPPHQRLQGSPRSPRETRKNKAILPGGAVSAKLVAVMGQAGVLVTPWTLAAYMSLWLLLERGSLQTLGLSGSGKTGLGVGVASVHLLCIWPWAIGRHLFLHQDTTRRTSLAGGFCRPKKYMNQNAREGALQEANQDRKKRDWEIKQ